MKALFLALAIMLLATTAGATYIPNGELLPIFNTTYTFTTATGPTEDTYGDVWVFENGEEWKPISAGFDFMHWNANIYYRYFNGRNSFYYMVPGNEHRVEYPPTPTPIPSTLFLLGTGLIGIGLMRRRNSNES